MGFSGKAIMDNDSKDLEDINELLSVMVAECHGENCRAKVFLPEAFKSFGAIFLHGRENGFVGFVCPTCRQTTLLLKEREAFERIKELFVCSSQDSSQTLLRYRSFPYSLDDHQDSGRFYQLAYTKCAYDKEFSISEMDIRLDLRRNENDDPGELPSGYCSYGFGDRIMGPAATIWWYEEAQIPRLLEIEHETGAKVFPRYFPYAPLIEKADDFTFSYYLSPDFEQWQRASWKTAVVNPLNIYKRDIHKHIHYLNILDSMVQPADGDNGCGVTIRTPEEMGGIATIPADGLPQTAEAGCEQERLRILDHLWDNFSERDVQSLLSRTSARFAAEYPRLSQRSDFSFALFWKLKEGLLGEISRYIWKESLSRQRYALYKDGASWTLVFDGKKISGLRGSGFKYIQYLVQHRGRQFSTEEISMLDGVTSGKADRSYENQEALRAVKAGSPDVSQKIGDRRVISNLKKALGDLCQEREQATENNDVGRLDKINEQITQYEEYLREYIGIGAHGRQFNNESKRTQRRITKSVERAVKQLEKYDLRVYRHFITAIHPINSFSLSYTPLEPLDWHAG